MEPDARPRKKLALDSFELLEQSPPAADSTGDFFIEKSTELKYGPK